MMLQASWLGDFCAQESSQMYQQIDFLRYSVQPFIVQTASSFHMDVQRSAHCFKGDARYASLDSTLCMFHVHRLGHGFSALLYAVVDFCA